MTLTSPNSITRPACEVNPQFFYSDDIEDEAGNLLTYHYPHEKQAKALCATCPVFDWCAENFWTLEGVIVAGRRDDERKGRRKRNV